MYVPAYGRFAFPLKDSQQKRKNNKTTIQGQTIMAFQVGVPAWGFSAKDDKQQKTDSEAQSKQNKKTHSSAATGVFRKKQPVAAERRLPPL